MLVVAMGVASTAAISSQTLPITAAQYLVGVRPTPAWRWPPPLDGVDRQRLRELRGRELPRLIAARAAGRASLELPLLACPGQLPMVGVLVQPEEERQLLPYARARRLRSPL